MNCIEYRRLYTADPNNLDDALAQHRENCADCAEFTLRMEIFESELVNAANIDVPGLESRILLHTMNKAQQQEKVNRLYAIAASIVMMLGVFVFLTPTDVRPLDEEVFAHITEEIKHLHDRKWQHGYCRQPGRSTG